MGSNRQPRDDETMPYHSATASGLALPSLHINVFDFILNVARFEQLCWLRLDKNVIIKHHFDEQNVPLNSQH
jgi:hypothetical protein